MNIKVITFEQWLEIEYRRQKYQKENNPEYHQNMVDRHLEKIKQREALIEKYPFTLAVEGPYPAHEFANRWCWINIGTPQIENCEEIHSEFPGCPIVLQTEYIQTGCYHNKENQRVYWSEKAYIEENVPEHGHSGTWKLIGLGKTGYDYGCCEFCFESESDRDKFVAAIPFFNFGEEYKEMYMSKVAEKNVHQSKWGFHPISFSSSKKLRFINSVYEKAQRLAGSWERWNRKEPQNLVIRRAIRNSSGQKIGSEIVKVWDEPKVCSLFFQKGSTIARNNGFGGKILFASKQARTPQPTPEEVLPFHFTEEEIDQLYESAKEWIDNI